MIYMSFEYKDWYKKSEEPKHEMEYGVLIMKMFRKINIFIPNALGSKSGSKFSYSKKTDFYSSLKARKINV